MTESETTFIYGLVDPITNKVRYVGKSINPKRRLYFHVREAQGNQLENSHKLNWIRKLLSQELCPTLKILQECAVDDWQKAEKYWISKYRKDKLGLTNVLDGGNSPPLLSDLTNEQRNYHSQRVSQSNKVRKPPNEGRKWSEEYKDGMSIALSGENNSMFGLKGEDHPAYGRIVSSETRERLSKAATGSKNGMYGKTHSDEAREKLSKSSEGRMQSDETKAKRSLSCLMFHALKRKDINKVILLQKKYRNCFGGYHSKYLDFV